jgi:hypothetical protein
MRKRNPKVSTTVQISVMSLASLRSAYNSSNAKLYGHIEDRPNCRCTHAPKLGDENMLGMVATVLIVLWLLGFFAFHVTTAFIHVALVMGVILLVVHFMRGSTASV